MSTFGSIENPALQQALVEAAYNGITLCCRHRMLGCRSPWYRRTDRLQAHTANQLASDFDGLPTNPIHTYQIVRRKVRCCPLGLV